MKPKVLIVEDDEIIREVYALKFELEGYPVAVAENGQIGLEKAKEFEPEIILLDMMMPVMGGLEFMQRFSSRGGTQIIVFSNISAPGQVNDVLKLGASAYWIKSDYTPDRAVAAVGEHWSKKQAS